MPPPVRRLPLIPAVVGAALALAGSAAGDTGLAPADPVSPNAERASDVYYFILVFAVAVFLIVTVPLVLFIVRFRGRGRERAVEGPQVRGNTSLELAWTAAPVLILAAIAAFVFYKLPGITSLEATAGGERMKVRVEGRQFYWQYEYENGVIAIDRLRAPVGTIVDLEITAPEGDVNHSYWVPPLGGKFDAIPGVVTRTSFQAQRAGRYEGQCGEFCGIQHAAMRASIEVIPRAEFDRWLEREARAQEEGTTRLGEEEWIGVCAKCHGPDVVGKVGPELRGNPILNDAEAVEVVVRRGRGAMPAVGEGWSERQMDALTKYLRNVVAKQGGESDGDEG